MKTIKNFAAQQLSKKQMNEVKGGTIVWECRWKGGMTMIAEDFLPLFAEQLAGSGLTVNCRMV